MDHSRFRATVARLYEVVGILEEMFPGRPFTPDGHLVGSLGECLVADAYGIELLPPSNEGFDGIARDGRKVEIKATQARSVAFRSEPEHCIVIKISKDGTFAEHYNGPGKYLWALVKDKPRPSNGQYQISLSRLSKIQEQITDEEKVARDD